MQKFQKKDIYILFFLLTTILLYFFYSFKNYDLGPADDDVYLKTALLLKLPYEQFDNLLYPLLMRVFGFFSANNINLIYNFYFFISGLVFLAFFYYLRYSKLNFAISYLLSTAFLFSNFQIGLSPRLTLLNLIFGFVFLSIISTKSERYIKWGFMTVCLLLCNYVSVPEFLIFFLLSFAIFLYKTLSNKSLTVSGKIKPIGIVLGILGILFYFGGGIENQSVFVREYKYHFLDNWELWTGEHYDFQDELNVFDRVYGKSNSLYEFVTVNPKLFLKHILYNLGKYIITVLGIFKSCFYQPFVSFFGHYTKYVFGVFVLFIVFTIDLKATFSSLKNQLNIHKVNIAFLEIFSLPGLVIAILVYPRNHFTILDLPIYFLIVGLLIQSIVLKTNKVWNWTRWILLVGFIGGIFLQKPIFNDAGHVASYKYIQSASLKKDLSILSNDFFGYNYYSGHTTIQNYDPNNDDLVKLLATQKYDILTLYSQDLEVPKNRAFVAKNYLQTDYVRVRKFEGVKRYIFVKKELEHLFSEN
ncbi:hypothetical protein EGI22_08060 [Lacihabitans sp. LS3-19]|uniref:hypothetical protein n=1 Tax=Lacihabitans sp. LS3-19 TaxID=2487335 RepID=UPI0020CE333A|nr:hypothetical protein [Lacihabitans sp. LS3-19]MCP9767864.1 hypothetical protein [Lacihabitans sp. LS3-19]